MPIEILMPALSPTMEESMPLPLVALRPSMLEPNDAIGSNIGSGAEMRADGVETAGAAE